MLGRAFIEALYPKENCDGTKMLFTPKTNKNNKE
jgi:hypothetical protein